MPNFMQSDKNVKKHKWNATRDPRVAYIHESQIVRQLFVKNCRAEFCKNIRQVCSQWG